MGNQMTQWKTVPVEPTPEMLKAADDGDDAYTLLNFGAGAQRVMQGPYDHYAAMLAAAPETPQPTKPAEQMWAEYVETACALIKAADDAAADGDYMLDSDDCIKVLRGQWGAPLANDHPPKPQPAKRETLVEWALLATPAEINAANWRVVLQGLLKARYELEKDGATHSWVGPYIDIARHGAKNGIGGQV